MSSSLNFVQICRLHNFVDSHKHAPDNNNMIIYPLNTCSFFLKKVMPLCSHSGDVFHYVQQFILTFFHKELRMSSPQRKLLLHADQNINPNIEMIKKTRILNMDHLDKLSSRQP